MQTINLNPTTIVQYLQKASNAYYDGKPFITDEEYDSLRDKLIEIDPENLFLNEIGAQIQTGWPTHKHRSLMGSLSKIKTKEEYLKWTKDKGHDFVLTEKYDGSTVTATYVNGKLTTLATRGDGITGENITKNAKHIKNIPETLKESFSGEIRGEAMLRISLFERYFRPLGYSNPRNSANGKVRDMKDDPLKNHIEIMWFDIIPTHRDLKSEVEKWNLISKLGLVTQPPVIYGDSENLWKEYEAYCAGKRAQLDWEIDGLVIKINNLDLQESYGIINNRPKGALAIKFPSEEKETTVDKIIWNRGLTGVYCPTAYLTPVEIGGVTVSKASLCGIEEINRLNVSAGDRVIISRRNDVIPKVERVTFRTPNRPNHTPPDVCEICNEKLVREGAYIICLNSECQGETYGDLMTWIREFKIKGFGPSMIRALISEDITDIAKLYSAPQEVFEMAANSDKNGNRRYLALREGMSKVKLSTFLSALNVRALGNTNAQRLEQKFKNLNAILNATIEELKQIPGIKTNADKIYQGLQEKKELINKLQNILTINDLDSNGPLAGKSFCITGELSLPRPFIQDWIKSLGGEVKNGVSKTLNYLVTMDPNSGTGKNQKADQFGIQKISEGELYKLANITSEEIHARFNTAH